jgi:cytochrome c oxidase subunit 2
LFIVVLYSILGAGNLANTIRPSQNAMVVKVTAFQWDWKFEYPEYGITTNELYLPLNRAVLFRMESSDVIHSFWVPEFRVKQDVVPGRVTELRITPTLITPADQTWKVRCAEICGTSHYKMERLVRVVDQTTYDAWVAERQEEAAQLSATPEGHGQLLVTANGCAACHSTNGSAGVGPTWRGLFGREEELEDGTTIIADEAYLFESIRDPRAKIVRGFPPTMPVYPFTDEEINDIIAYIKTLR